MQNVLRAVSCPHGEKPVIRVLQRAATANRDESGVAIFGKDHNFAHLSLYLPNGSRQWQVGGLRLAVETEKTPSHEKG